MTIQRGVALIAAAAFCRSLAIGLMGVTLGIELARSGYDALRIGLVIAAGLAGSAAATLVTSFHADRLGRRRTLLSLSLLSAGGGAGFAVSGGFGWLMAVAFFGMVNGMGRDRGAAFALEQAVIPQAVSAVRRTLALSWYNLVIDSGHALGALGGALPTVLERVWALSPATAYREMFGLYAALYGASAVLYSLLGGDVELGATGAAKRRVPLTPQSRRRVAGLAGLFGLDAFGGGLLGDALISYWFFRRFGIPAAAVGPLFFGVHALNSLSYLAAAWLARRIGLVNTIVFTHLPSSLLLIAVPLAPSFGWAAALYLARAALVEMDVPTRQSFVVAVVRPEERVFASGVTNLTRNVAWMAGPGLAGWLMQEVSLGAPLLVGGGFKIAHDLLLWAAFRSVKPPEEAGGTRANEGKA
ncbi:MAG TPA: MFS transporter [Candidatus Acidoferrales bacterium]|nr:MFS transporter [Candidatus Acidoferrales bacterium]